MARGSIQKRTVQSKKDGKPIEQYYVVYDTGLQWDEEKGHHRRRQKWEKVESPNTRKHAEKVLAERLAQLHRGEFIEPSKITFREFADTWVEKYAKGQVKPSTLARHLSTLRTHLLPAFGERELGAIDVEDIQGFKAQKMSSPLSPQSVKNLLAQLRQMFNCAVEWGYLRSNPALKVKHPKVPKKVMDCLSPDEVRLFLDHVPAKWSAFFRVAVTTGLRLGELLAMRWGNLDWNQGQYFVKETLGRKMETQERGFYAPKTEGSTKPVDLTPACLCVLEDHRKDQAVEKLKAGPDYQDMDLIFATPGGTPWDDRNIVHRVFEPILKDAGLRRIRFHDLRHTCASLLIAQGESPKYIQRQLRHASIQITFDRYGHLFPDANRAAMLRMDETLFGKQNETGAKAV